MRLIAISDIHGCNITFNALLNKIEFKKSDRLILLGDYINRGPSSKKVLDTIFILKKNNYQVICLKGNHEQLMQSALIGAYHSMIWKQKGGIKTLKSFGVQNAKDIPSKYYELILNLKLIHQEQEFIFVHAGFNFKFENPFLDKNALIWVRNWYKNINHKWLGNRKIIHGHMPITKNNITIQLNNIKINKFLNIDNGCYYAKEGMNNLCAIDLTNNILHFQKNVEFSTEKDSYQFKLLM